MKESPTKTICFFNSNKAWGGGEKWHFTTCKEFQRRGYNTILATNVGSQLYRKGTEERLRTQPFHVNNLTFLNPIKIFTLALFFKAHKVDAVILNLPADLKYAGLAAKLAGVKKIIYRRGMPHPLRNTWLNRFLFQKVLTGVIANSNEVKSSLTKNNETWFPEEKISVIYNGIDTSIPLDQSKYYKKQDGEFVIGNAGRLTEQKGQKYLIELGKMLKQEGIKFKILIAGEGELRTELTNSIKAEGLENEIQLCGHIENMSAFYNSLDCFVFPSLFEGMSNTLVEVMWHEVPVIVWDISSNSEIVSDNKNGHLVEINHLERLFEKIIFLRATKDVAIIRNAKETILSKFDYQMNINKLKELISI